MQLKSYHSQPLNKLKRSVWQRLHLDAPLLGGLAILVLAGLFILYSATNESFSLSGLGRLQRQFIWLILAFGIMFTFAQISPDTYQKWAPWIFIGSIVMLIFVLLLGATGKGAQRWISLGFLRFQPSEILKLAVPLMLAWYLNDKPLPPRKNVIIISCLIIFIPALLVAKQPDLGTAIIIIFTGVFVLFLAGISWRLIFGSLLTAAICAPVLWHFMHDYQRKRVLTLLNPERDPLGSGYHIIQSKIAIGSGGFFGKGWLNGTQSHLQFLPEHATDFIFAVCGEELGLLGALILIIIFLYIIGRGLYISLQAQDTFSRLLAGSLSLTFFSSMFINIGMVTGILPVVGIPLPLVSYGGTSMISLMAAFGMIMSIQTHRKLVAKH